MYFVVAIVREEKLDAVKAALNDIDVKGITVSQVFGCGKQKGYTELVRSTEVEINLIPKIKFEIAVSTREWKDKTIEAVTKAAGTNNVGDGKIFTFKLEDVVRIRTGERDVDALN